MPPAPVDPAATRAAALRQRMEDVRSRSARLRTEAFVDYAPRLCGFALQPITFLSYQRLVAFNNAFVTGAPVDLRSIFQFVWVHHPAFSQHADRARRRVFRRVWRSLHPRLPTLNAALLALRGLPRLRWLSRLVRPTAAECQAAAIAEIRRLVHEALHDFPAPGDDARPSPYAGYPHYVSLLERAHPMSFAEARVLVDHAPLKQLVQWVREAIDRLSRGKDKLLTAEEARVWADWLDFKNEQVASTSAAPGAPAAL